ncbi:tRNA (adenosine(37)-N6)-threonylcarbamoyltransferase complex dimerization subunit type 1 TsaB [Thermaurantiacus sp.]
MPDPLTGEADASAPSRRTTLAVATGHALSLALLQGPTLCAFHHEPMARGHAEALIPVLRTLLAGQPRPAEIRVETGPGSFTGLRVGIAAARALALAWNCPVHGVTSMQLVAAAAKARGHQGPLLVLLAAPRGQLWVQPLDDCDALAPPVALDPAQARARMLAWKGAATGSGLTLLGLPALEQEPDARFAGMVAPPRLGPPLPLYIRPQPDRQAA